jgi:hypothetical protein
MTSAIGNHTSAIILTAQEVDKDKGLGPSMTLTDTFEASTGNEMCYFAISVDVKKRAGSLLVRTTLGSISLDAMVLRRTRSKKLFNG